MPPPLIILGNDSAAAERSAERSGFEAHVIPTLDLPTALKTLGDAPPDAPVLFTEDAIDEPSLLMAAALERRLLTPVVDAVTVLRKPKTLRSLPRFHGLRPVKRSWFSRLIRKAFSGDEPAGEPIKAIFIADGWSVRLLGAIAGQGDRLAELSETQRAALNHVAVVLTQRHDVRGLFALSATAHGQKKVTPRAVTPAFTDTMGRLETLTKVNVIADADRSVKMRRQNF